MKAYILSDKTNDDKGQLVVFANTAKEAKKMDDGTIDVDEYIDLVVKRVPAFDGMENLSDRELCLAKWRKGWWFDVSSYPDCEEATDDEFYRWYDKTYSN